MLALSAMRALLLHLSHWGRDRVRGEKIDLPTLIKCQSRDTARAVDLTDRGTLEPGMKADVNIVDFENLSVRLPEIVNDLPAGGARLQQRADGYLMTIVNGEPTYIEGEETILCQDVWSGKQALIVNNHFSAQIIIARLEKRLCWKKYSRNCADWF